MSLLPSPPSPLLTKLKLYHPTGPRLNLFCLNVSPFAYIAQSSKHLYTYTPILSCHLVMSLCHVIVSFIVIMSCQFVCVILSYTTVIMSYIYIQSKYDINWIIYIDKEYQMNIHIHTQRNTYTQ